MGNFWLWNLPDVLKAAGLQVDTYPGWETRARSTGGYDKVLGVQVHHTASNTTQTNDMNYMWHNAADRPIGAIYLARDGRVTVGAAGATNTSGKGGPRQTSLGTIPLDAANRYVISIEAANAGNGEQWPQAQIDAYVKMCKALHQAYGLSVGDVHSHWEWTSRKVDPAGNSPYATGSNKWNMDKFRGDVWASGGTPPTPEPPPEPPTPPVVYPGVPDMFHPMTPFRNSDTRPFGVSIQPGDHKFGLAANVFPADVAAVAMNVTAVDPTEAGFITVWPSGPRPDTSCVNYEKGGAHNGAVVVGIKDFSFMIFNHTPCRLICDITGYWTP